jgi:hypothetical protein
VGEQEGMKKKRETRGQGGGRKREEGQRGRMGREEGEEREKGQGRGREMTGSSHVTTWPL